VVEIGFLTFDNDMGGHMKIQLKLFNLQLNKWSS